MKRTTKTDAYEAYVKQYKKNVAQVSRYDNPITADKLREDMMSRPVFESSMTEYRAMWAEQHPNRHGESADRLAKWVANKETKDRSYKQAQNIKRVAKEMGFELTTNEIQFGSSKTEAFWDAYVGGLESGLIERTIWGSP